MFVVTTRDGKTLHESEVDWKDINVHDITSTTLHRGARRYTMAIKGENVDKLLQLKRAVTSNFGGSGGVVTERVLGFIIGDVAVKLEIDEYSGNVKLTAQRLEGKKWIKL